jgi:hypothetical protein
MGTQALERFVDLGACRAARRAFLLLDLEVDLFAEYRDFARGVDADPDLFAHDREHGDLDLVADHDGLVGLSGQYEHPLVSLSAVARAGGDAGHLGVSSVGGGVAQEPALAGLLGAPALQQELSP